MRNASARDGLVKLHPVPQGCPEQGGRETPAARRRIYLVFFLFAVFADCVDVRFGGKGPGASRSCGIPGRGSMIHSLSVCALGQVRVWGRTSILPVRFRASSSLILVWLVLQPRARPGAADSQPAAGEAARAAARSRLAGRCLCTPARGSARPLLREPLAPSPCHGQLLPSWRRWHHGAWPGASLAFLRPK